MTRSNRDKYLLWGPKMAYQRLLSDAVQDFDFTELDTENSRNDNRSLTPVSPSRLDTSFNEQKSKKSQILDLTSILEKGVAVYRRNNSIYIRYHGVATFRIEMNYQQTTEYTEATSETDNRIYLEGIDEHPVYMEAIPTVSGRNQLANFWFSFSEHGLQSVLNAHHIIVRQSTPDILSGSC